MSTSLSNLKVFDAVKELWERVKITGMNYSELKDCLDNGYNYIKWNVNISNQQLQSLSEFKDIIYKVEWAFDCNDNSITSFEGFPKMCTSLDCRNNRIKSAVWIPSIWHNVHWNFLLVNPTKEELKIDWNYFYQMEKLVDGKLYRYGSDYFYIKPLDINSPRDSHLYSLDKKWFEDIVWIIPESLSWRDLWQYLDRINSIYQKDIWCLLKIENNFVNINNRKFLKKILLPEFHLNWGIIEDIEVLTLNEKTVKINWKLYNKKVSKSLN